MRFTFLSDDGRVMQWDDQQPDLPMTSFAVPLLPHEDIRSIARLWDGSFYIASSAQYVLHCGPGTAPTVAAGGHGRGGGLDQVNEVSYMAIDGDGNLYMSDENNHRVLRRTSEGIITVVAGGNGRGRMRNQLDIPQGVEVDSTGALFVADCNNNRVMRWDPDSESGVLVAGGNGRGRALSQLNDPSAIALDCYGNLYVADLGNGRIVRWAPLAYAGVVLVDSVRDTTAGGPIKSQLTTPTDMAIIDGADGLCIIMVTDETYGDPEPYGGGCVHGAAVRFDLTTNLTNEQEIVLRGRFQRVIVETYEAWSPQLHARFPSHFWQPASLICLILLRHGIRSLDIRRLVTGYVLYLHKLTHALYRVQS